MKNIKILSIEKKPKSKKYKVITDDLDYTVSEDMIIKYQLQVVHHHLHLVYIDRLLIVMM